MGVQSLSTLATLRTPVNTEESPLYQYPINVNVYGNLTLF